MNNVIFYGIFLLSIMFISACATQVDTTQPVCSNNYYEFQKGQCCVDLNNNQVCDNDEIINEDKKDTEKKDITIKTENNEKTELTEYTISDLQADIGNIIYKNQKLNL